MSKIHNSVYGLALGDAIAYRTEFSSFANTVAEYANEDLPALKSRMLVSDDTQMSLYLLRGFRNAYNAQDSFEKQYYEIIESISMFFIDWFHDPENYRAPGIACMNALDILYKEVSSLSYMKKKIIQHRKSVDDFLVGGEHNSNSKGSGTVMRSPWIGILHAHGIVPDESLERFCNLQASITHQHPTALHASYLTALLTSKLYRGELKPGELGDFATEFCDSQESDLGWRDLSSALEKLKDLPKNYTSLSAEDFDPSSVLGSHGTAEDVLITAIGIIDAHGDEPIDVLRRCMFTGGDSDTIGAVAGGMLGAYYADNIWKDIEHLVEEQYVLELEDAVSYLELL